MYEKYYFLRYNLFTCSCNNSYHFTHVPCAVNNNITAMIVIKRRPQRQASLDAFGFVTSTHTYRNCLSDAPAYDDRRRQNVLAEANLVKQRTFLCPTVIRWEGFTLSSKVNSSITAESVLSFFFFLFSAEKGFRLFCPLKRTKKKKKKMSKGLYLINV